MNLINDLDSANFFWLFGDDSSKIFDKGWTNVLPDILKGLYHISLIKVKAAFLLKRTQQSWNLSKKWIAKDDVMIVDMIRFTSTIHSSFYVLCTEHTKLFWLLTYKGKSCHVYNHNIIFYDSFLFWKIAVFFSKEKYPSL